MGPLGFEPRSGGISKREINHRISSSLQILEPPILAWLYYSPEYNTIKKISSFLKLTRILTIITFKKHIFFLNAKPSGGAGAVKRAGLKIPWLSAYRGSKPFPHIIVSP